MRNIFQASFRIIKGQGKRKDFFNVSELTRDDFLSTIGFRLDKTWELKGKVISGVQKASFFTQLDWVQEQCMEKLGFRPYPGTLNLQMDISEENRSTIHELRREDEIQLIPPDPNFCPATMLPVYIGGIKGAIVMPSEEVNIHGKEIIEVMAPLKLRDALGVKDGDTVVIVIDKYV